MTPPVYLRAPLQPVTRGPAGRALAEADGRINDWPLTVTLTDSEIHIAFADRDGPSFAVDLRQVFKGALNEIELLLGLPQKGRR